MKRERCECGRERCRSCNADRSERAEERCACREKECKCRR